jgi:hypothetical protein
MSMSRLTLLGGFLIGLATLVLACRVGPRLARVPKEPDIIIKADEAYLEGEEQERDLALKYYAAMEKVIAETRKVFPVEHFEFFERQLGFYKGPKGQEGSYFGLGAYTEETFDTATTNRNRRVATIFTMYGKPLLQILSAREEVMEDPRVKGVKIYLTYWKKNVARQRFGKGSTEWVEFFFKKEDVSQYLKREITDQELMDNNYVLMETGRVKVDMGEAL